MLEVEIKKSKQIVEIKKQSKKNNSDYFRTKTNLYIKPTMENFRI